MKHIVFNIALFMLLFAPSDFVHGQTQVEGQKARLVVSFNSICCGIDHEAQEELNKFIGRYEKAKGKTLKKAAVYWGKEGEIDYCFKLSELSAREQKRFISKVRFLLRKSKLVHTIENALCRSKR